MGDMVARRNTLANVGSLNAIMDRDRFRSRVEELAKNDSLAKPEADVVREFLEAWKRHDKNPRD